MIHASGLWHSAMLALLFCTPRRAVPVQTKCSKPDVCERGSTTDCISRKAQHDDAPHNAHSPCWCRPPGCTLPRISLPNRRLRAEQGPSPNVNAGTEQILRSRKVHRPFRQPVIQETGFIMKLAWSWWPDAARTGFLPARGESAQVRQKCMAFTHACTQM